MIVPEVLERAARDLGDTVAITVDRGDDADAHLSFAEWNARSDALAAALVDAGVQPGDRVGIGFENRDADRFCVGYFAVLKAGGVAVPVGTRMAEREVEHVLRHAEARAIVGDDVRTDLARRAIPGIRAFDFRGYDSAIAARRASPRIARSPEDLCDILYTSGTTGVPKGVASTHANVVHLAFAAFDAFRGQSYLHAIPMWTFAGTHAMQFMPLRAGMRSIVMHKFDARRYLVLVERYAVRVSYVVPAMLKLALDALDDMRDKPDRSSMLLLMFGSAPTPPALLSRIPELVPNATLINLYGQTEAGSAGCAMVIQPGTSSSRPGSVGRPLPPAEIKVVLEDGRDAGPDEIGEIWIRTRGQSRSYYRDPEATSHTFVDGWVRTGDLGHVDRDGYLYLDDRKKDLVIRGGLNVFPAEIDALLEAHPAVREAAVIGVPHHVLGEDLAAFVALREGRTASGDDLRAYLLEHIADYKVPRTWVFVPALPRSAMGKVLKRQLREEHRGGGR